MTTKKIALFIDADNISAKFGKQIIEALEGRGEIFIRRIYGNWEKALLHGWNECILNYSLRPVQQIDFAAGKNATDMSLTIDAMDVLYGGKAEVFALVSNDSDFTPLAIRLREGCVNVIGLGTAKVSNSFRSACNEFIMLETPNEVQSAPAKEVPVQSAANVQILKPASNLVKKTSTAKSAPVQLSLFEDNIQPQPSSSKVVPITAQSNFDNQRKLQVLHDILQEAARTHGDRNGFVALCWAGQGIREKNLDFGVKDFGYGSLHGFIADFPNLYEVIQRETGENFCYRCLKNVKKNPAQGDEDKLRQLHTILRDSAKTHGDGDGFSLLNHAGQEIKSKKLGFGIRDFGYRQLREFVLDFPDLYETAQDTKGQHFRYRCRQA